MQIQLRAAAPADLEQMLHIVAQGKAFLKEQGVDQWQMGDPNREGLARDIENGEAYVALADGKISATMALTTGEESNYRQLLTGNWGGNEPYLTIHRFAVDASLRGTGAARYIAEELDALCRAKNLSWIRVDTHAENLPMQRFLAKNGFVLRGSLILIGGAENGKGRIALDKYIPPLPAGGQPACP